MGEADEEPGEVARFFGKGDKLHMLLNFYLSNYLFLSLAEESAHGVAHALLLLPRVPDGCAWANFLRNLDELDLERLTEEERERVLDAFAPYEDMRIFGRGIRRRLAPMLEGNQARYRMAQALLFSLPGAPVLMYGDEIGMGENLDWEGRTAVRGRGRAPGPGALCLGGRAHRLAQLRRHLDHLRALRPRVPDAVALRSDLSLHNDVLFSLLTVTQLVIDIAGELAGRKGLRFEDYTKAVRALEAYDELPTALVDQLVRLPGFRNVLIHEYVGLDLDRAVAALDALEPIEDFVRAVAGIVERWG